MKALLSTLLLLAAGCAHAPRPEVVWPSPPDKARIRFVSSFAQTEDLDESRFAGMRRTLLGDAGEQALASPTALAVSDDGQRVYVADYGSAQLLKADLVARTLTPFGHDDLRGRPFGVALDQEENLYVTESVGGVDVAVFAKDGHLLRRFGREEKLERPTGIAVDRVRKLVYVVDSSTQASVNHRVLVYDTGGRFLRALGEAPGRSPRGEEEGQFHFPVHVALRSDGQVFIGDTMNFRIQVFDPSGRFVRKFGQAGDSPGTFARIKGLAFDRFDNLYVADGEHSVVQLFNRDDQLLLFFGGFQPGLLEYFDVPGGIAIHLGTNRIFVCNEHRARINVYELINTSAEDSRGAGR